mmetsp:Transcript_30816/g.77348  ORF Transcript_30816/g.77348 Transcript_30816/m.77348 type:complete len:211 (+) Transcript_30816:695-1327(+)
MHRGRAREISSGQHFLRHLYQLGNGVCLLLHRQLQQHARCAPVGQAIPELAKLLVVAVGIQHAPAREAVAVDLAEEVQENGGYDLADQLLVHPHMRQHFGAALLQQGQFGGGRLLEHKLGDRWRRPLFHRLLQLLRDLYHEGLQRQVVSQVGQLVFQVFCEVFVLNQLGGVRPHPQDHQVAQSLPPLLQSHAEGQAFRRQACRNGRGPVG